MLATKLGHSIRFGQEQVRPMGREAAGVNGIKLRPGDSVIRMDLVTKTDTLHLHRHREGLRQTQPAHRLQGAATRRTGYGGDEGHCQNR